ncbi:DNA polymerase epsilon catalytic subunit, partial [Coemansia sp. RSA 2399]
MLGDNQQPVFGIPPGRGGGRGRGNRGFRGGRGGGGGGRRQPLPLGGNDADVAMADAFPEKQRDDTANDNGGSYNSIEFRNDAVQVIDQIDSKLGFDRYQEGPTRLGWLVNMHATSVPDEERNSVKSAVDFYFLEQD